MENTGKNKVKKTQARTLIRTRGFIIKNIKSLFGDAEEIYDYEQSKLCLLISKHKIDVKTFSNASNAKELDLVQAAVKSEDSLLNIYVNVFGNDICLPVEKQNI